MKLTLEEKIAHGGHPVLRWMMDNIFVRTDPAGNIKPDKEKSTERIDHQLRVLKQAKLVRFRREGRVVYYSLDDDHVKAIFDQGYQHILERN